MRQYPRLIRNIRLNLDICTLPLSQKYILHHNIMYAKNIVSYTASSRNKCTLSGGNLTASLGVFYPSLRY